MTANEEGAPVVGPPGGQESTGKEPSGAVRAWTYVGLGFIGVFAVALLLFMEHGRRRESELERLFTRAAARLGAQIELRYANYAQLVENVTRVLRSAESESTDASFESLASARETLEDERRRAEQAKQRTEAARRLQQTIAEASVQGSVKGGQADAEALKRAKGAVDAWLSLSLESERADRARGHAAERVVESEAAFRRAVERMAQSRSAAAGEESAGAAAHNELEWAEANLSRAQDALREARNAADRAWLRALDAGDAAEQAWEKTRAANVERPAQSAPEASAKGDNRRVTEVVAREDAPGPVPREVPQTVESIARARRFRERASQLVLPSYRSAIAACPTSSGLASTMLCVARQVAELGGGATQREQGLEMVECPQPAGDKKGPQDTAKLSADGRFLYLPTSGTARAGSPCARIRMTRLVGAAKEPSTPIEFEAVALFRPDGTAIHMLETDSSLRIAELPNLKGLPLRASATTADVELGGQKYRVYTQPIRIKLELGEEEGVSSGVRTDLVLAGFVPESALLRAKREISLDSYLWVVLLLGFGVLSLPLAKLWLLGPNGFLTRFDVRTLATSAGVMTLFSAVLLMCFVAHNRLFHRTDELARNVAGELARRVEARVSKGGAALRAFTANAVPISLAKTTSSSNGAFERYRHAEVCAEKAKGGLLDSASFPGDAGRWVVCEITHFDLPGAPAWTLASISNARGYQLSKFTPGAHATAPISVARREYFRRARADQTACTNPECSERAAVEIVRSGTKGSLVMLLAKSLPGVEGIAALETPLDELRELLVPLGFTAMVIDRQGRVLLHSHDEDAHGQMLFADVDNQRELRAALVNQTGDSIELGYLGIPSRVRLEPLGLSGLGWSAVVIVPKSIVEIAAMDILLVTLFAFGAVVVFALACVCSILFAKRIAWVMTLGRRFPPREKKDGGDPLSVGPILGRSHDYARAGLLMLNFALLLCLLAFLGMRWLPPTLLLLLLLFLGWLTLCEVPGIQRQFLTLHPFSKATPALWEKLRASRLWQALRSETDARSGPGGAKWRDDLRLTYTLCAIGLAVMFIVTPAAILFSSAYEHVVETLIQAESYDLSSKLSGREPCPARGEPENRDCANVISTGERPSEATEARGERVSCAVSLVKCLADHLPPLGSKEIQRFGRLYRVDHRGQLSSVPLPSLLSASFHWPGIVVLVLAFGSFFALASIATQASLNRLFFIDLLQRHWCAEPAPPLTPPRGASWDEMTALWRERDDRERRVLAHLAFQGYANPHVRNRRTVDHLVSLGILSRERLAIANPEFTSFLREVVSDEQLKHWAATDQGSAWHAMRVPLSATVVALFGAISVSNPELGAASALVPTLAAGLPLVLKATLQMLDKRAGA